MQGNHLCVLHRKEIFRTDVKWLDKIGNLLEERGLLVVYFEVTPVFGGPFPTCNPCLIYELIVFALGLYRYGQPEFTIRRLDHVAVSPVSSRVLNIVVDDKLIHTAKEIKIPLPGDVVLIGE